jgi:reductive dehalogenase
MFARMARRPGTPAYEDYYSRRPQLRKPDDRIRSMPGLGRPGGRHHHPEISAEAEAFFDDIPGLEPKASVVRQWAAKLDGAPHPTVLIEKMVRALGAVAVGCAPVDDAFVYTHKGRHDTDYGRKIPLDHPTAIVFLVEMDFDAMQRAPRAETLRESARQYHRGAVVSKTVAAVLKTCGFEATSHHDAHYDVILPPLAVRAGLGELGRHNILIADRFGSRVRIGAVTTTLELKLAAPVDLGADHFCTVCRKCADSCPSHALSPGEKEHVRGVAKWPTNVERCYGYWRTVGTDCGICMAVCPFSHRNTLFHSLVRLVVRRASWTHRMAVWLDDLVYGRRWNPRATAGVKEV